MAKKKQQEKPSGEQGAGGIEEEDEGMTGSDQEGNEKENKEEEEEDQDQDETADE